MLESRRGTPRFLPRSRSGLLWRGLLAAVLVVVFAAVATATAGLLQVSSLAAELSIHSQSVKGLTLPAPGKPETLLLIGSDHRAGSTSYVGSNTDTMLLVRLDDASQTINVMSVPRDLDIIGPAGYPAKLNSIYSSDGGPAGLISVMRHQVFPKLVINHVIDTNFTGFSNLIDAIGCVYSQVDHRYYNLTQPYPSPDNYSSIDIQPGYQRLCGGVYSPTGTNSALAFVRFRHTDSDVVRNARQQDFIRWAKQGYSTSELLNNRDR
ncbi:MAG TPA: LCP family protein, partial [Solirubrobacteraceae bacterium]|nr:LCP family protein [Solirubrobacteraceae bacterium]